MDSTKRDALIVEFFRLKGIDYEALGDDSPAQDSVMHDYAQEVEHFISQGGKP